MFLRCILIFILIFSHSSFANDAVSWDQFTYSYLLEDSYTGFDISANKLVSESIFITGLYQSLEDKTSFFFEPDKYKAVLLGIGYRYSLSNDTDFFSVIKYEQVKSYLVDGSETHKMYGLEGGIRSMLTDNLEYSISFALTQVNPPNTLLAYGINASISYSISDRVSGGISYRKGLPKIHLSYLF